MRTTDFSRAPRQGRAEALVIVEAARAESVEPAPRALAQRARRARGFVWLARVRRRRRHGLVACFATEADAQQYAATLTGGWRSRVLTARPEGYSNGVWRAEGDVMQHIETFTPTRREREHARTPPRVAGPVDVRQARARRRETRADRAELDARDLTESAAMFIGATRYRGPRALRVLARTWYPMISRMRGLPGYVWHTVYWEAPFTLGTLAFFRTTDDLLGFARMPGHRMLMQWITRDRSNGTGGYIRIHSAPDAGSAEPARASANGTPS